MDRREYVITAEGAILRRNINEAPVQVTEQAIAALTQGITKRIMNVMEIGGFGQVHMTTATVGFYLTVNVLSIQIRAPFKILGNKEKVLTPNFSSATDPVMSMVWTPPSTMRVRLLHFCDENAAAGGGFGALINRQWLFAFDDKGQTWRLPLPNTHDDCSVCTGDKHGWNGSNYAEALDNGLKQFTNSTWNADLWKSAEDTQKMFRFEPDESKAKFKQLHYTGEWTKLCIKVAVAVSQYVIL